MHKLSNSSEELKAAKNISLVNITSLYCDRQKSYSKEAAVKYVPPEQKLFAPLKTESFLPWVCPPCDKREQPSLHPCVGRGCKVEGAGTMLLEFQEGEQVRKPLFFCKEWL